MKKIFVCLGAAVFVFASSLAFAKHILPPLFPTDNQFKIFMPSIKCGSVSVVREKYLDQDMGIMWLRYKIEEETNAVLVSRRFLPNLQWESWIDTNRDDHIDEFHITNDAAEQKYDSLCGMINAIKK